MSNGYRQLLVEPSKVLQHVAKLLKGYAGWHIANAKYRLSTRVLEGINNK